MFTAAPLPIYILAGGQSTRFGSDKARAEIGGVPLLARIIQTLAPAAASFTAVAGTPDKYADLGVKTIADKTPGLGPLGGLQAALLDLSEPGWLLLTSCDMVALDCAWIAALLSARKEGVPAVAFRGEKIEPLFALYHSGILNEVEHRIAIGRRSPARLIEETSSILLPLPLNWPKLAHINTPAELAVCLI